jgi:hypothetical protein
VEQGRRRIEDFIRRYMKRLLLALLAAMVVLGSGVAYAANRYPEGKCGDPVDKDDSLLAEGADGLLGSWIGDADEPRDADGYGQWSCINEKP